MKRQRKSPPPTTELNTIGVAPLALARGAATTLVRRVRRAVEVVQAVRSSVKSVAVTAEPVRVDVGRQVLNESAVVTLPIGLNDVALLGGVQVLNSNNMLTLTMNIDAYLIDRLVRHPPGQLVAQATARFNTQVQVKLHDTIESAVVPVRRKPRLLPGGTS